MCAICPAGVRTAVVRGVFQGMTMVAPSFVARELAARWLEDENGGRVRGEFEGPGRAQARFT